MKNRIRIILKRIYFFVLGLYHTEKKYEIIQRGFLLIDGCEDIDLKKEYKKGNLIIPRKPLAYYFDRLFSVLSEKIDNKKGFTLIRASDGEAFFLQGKVIGNINTRHYTLSGNLKNVDINLFKEGLLKCDLRHGDLYKRNRKRFVKIYGRDIFSDIPFECLYAAVASRKIFRQNWKMGIIGSENKIQIIKELLKSPEYCEYIGRSEFQDYIPVPERGTSNDPVGLANKINSQIKPEIQIYLVGIGIAKLAIFHQFTQNSNAVFFDAGAGISALSGFVGKERQYFAGWKNFRIKGFDYSKVDVMDADLKQGYYISAQN